MKRGAPLETCFGQVRRDNSREGFAVTTGRRAARVICGSRTGFTGYTGRIETVATFDRGFWRQLSSAESRPPLGSRSSFLMLSSVGVALMARTEWRRSAIQGEALRLTTGL